MGCHRCPIPVPQFPACILSGEGSFGGPSTQAFSALCCEGCPWQMGSLSLVSADHCVPASFPLPPLCPPGCTLLVPAWETDGVWRLAELASVCVCVCTPWGVYGRHEGVRDLVLALACLGTPLQASSVREP